MTRGCACFAHLLSKDGNLARGAGPEERRRLSAANPCCSAGPAPGEQVVVGNCLEVVVRACPVCESEMSPRFASECEPPIAWGCPECGLFQLESGGRPFTAEEEAALASHGFMDPARARRGWLGSKNLRRRR